MAKDKNRQSKVGAEEQEQGQLELVDFEEWYALRSTNIPSQHHKEILKADFKGRKVPVMATLADFDGALKEYGVELE
jgi:hypothetical protein